MLERKRARVRLLTVCFSTDFFTAADEDDSSSSEEDISRTSESVADSLPNPLPGGKLPSAAVALHSSQGSVFGEVYSVAIARLPAQ